MTPRFDVDQGVTSHWDAYTEIEYIRILGLSVRNAEQIGCTKK